MYWDVVEVRSEAGSSLWVRFADGLSGRFQLRPTDLTGVLARLRDPEFFKQVFVDHGAVAWPGEIDLAPDAMYEAIRRIAAGEAPTRAPTVSDPV
jgi:hypothetical protein